MHFTSTRIVVLLLLAVVSTSPVTAAPESSNLRGGGGVGGGPQRRSEETELAAAAARKNSLSRHGDVSVGQKLSEDIELSATAARQYSLIRHGDGGGPKLLEETKLSATTARKNSLIRHGDGKQTLSEETELSAADPTSALSSAGVAPLTILEDEAVHPALPDRERSLFGGCPGADMTDCTSQCPNKLTCHGTAILCFSFWKQNCYCHPK